MPVSRRILKPLFAILTLCFLVMWVGFGVSVWAQSTSTGSLAGSVTDSSGAAVSGAEITLTDTSTGASRTYTTNQAGRYTFVDLTPTAYEISISKPGFSTTKTNATIKIGVATTLDFTLKVGGKNEVVEVTATGTELETSNATVGNTVESQVLDALPSLNRDVSTFMELQPGVSPDGSVGGAVVDQSSFQLDGGNNTNDMDGSMSVYTATYAGDPTGGVSNQSNGVAAGPTGVMPTPADSVEEFKVNTANQGADFNSSSGGQVQIVTRRGTNTFHGSLYEYYLDNNFSANTWDNNFTGTPLPSWHRSRFGFRVGGPLIPKEIAGGKTYFFVNYEGYRWPLSETVERAVPSASMRLGLLSFDGGSSFYNLNPTPVTYNNVTYAPDNGTLDPRKIGISPLVSQLWNQHMPLPNEGNNCGLSRCDIVNVGGFKSNILIPTKSNFGVIRIDHDFGQKWHFNTTYHYFNLTDAGTQQVDIGGALGTDKLGVPSSLASSPQQTWYYTAGLTTNVSSNITNDFHYSFLRNWWAWGRTGDTPQVSGLGGAIEPGGESQTQALIPYNVNTQQTRTRFWDGHDHYLRDDLSLLKGNHLFQFGGAFQHNFNWHQRTDNGGGINYQPVYQLGTSSGAGVDVSAYTPAAIASNQAKTWGRDYAEVLGLVSISQQAYTRTGSNLAINPPLTPAFDQSTIPYYNVYFSDSWHMKKTFTLTYGLGWTLEMPPVEKTGKQIELVDQANQVIDSQSYLHTREQAALQGQVYNPMVGFNLVGNTENARKYPYDPFYGQFSPHIAGAWNPHFDSDSTLGKVFGSQNTVIRGGYGRIYGRLNGVDLVLVPLLGTGLIQPVQCFDPLMTGGACAGPSGATPANNFRIGVDGLTAPIPAATATLPQPLFPGVNGIAAGAGEALDPHFRPNIVDTFDLTIQRQLTKKLTMEIGYIGRLIHHEYQPININSVPYMMTVGGQRFDKAYANVVLQYCGGVAGMGGGGCAAKASAVTPQPFFEAALKGTGYCTGFANCTQALVANEGANGTGNLTFANVWSLWSDLDGGGATCPAANGGPCGFNFARTMMNSPLNCPTGAEIGCSGQLTSGVGVNASVGYGNYNGGFLSLKMADWRGLTAQSNFTWSKTLSTQSVVQATSQDTAVDPFNLRTSYGLAGFDRKFVYNMFIVYQPPYYKGQHGFAGHALGGWTFAPIFTAGTGLPMTLGTINGGGQAFGEGDSTNFYGNGNSENAIIMGPVPKTGVHYKAPGDYNAGIATSGLGSCSVAPPAACYSLNLFANPVSVYNSIRQPILGLDSNDGGWGVIRGLPYWNMDLSIKKNFRINERFNFEAQVVFTNVLNHVLFGDAPGDYLDTSSPASWGTIPGEVTGDTPRKMEFGARLNF